MDKDAVLLLLPLIFMIHDFEEIIMALPWFHRNYDVLTHRRFIPRTVVSHYEKIEPAGFTFVVAQEFILISALTISCIMMKWYDVWVAMLICFQLHLIVHIAQAALLRCYTPALVTSIICSGYTIYMFSGHLPSFQWINVMIWSLVIASFLVLDLWLAFKFSLRFQRWLKRFSGQRLTDH